MNFGRNRDPWETFNIAYFPENKELLETMQREMKQKAKILGDTLNPDRAKYDLYFSIITCQYECCIFFTQANSNHFFLLWEEGDFLVWSYTMPVPS